MYHRYWPLVKYYAFENNHTSHLFCFLSFKYPSINIYSVQRESATRRLPKLVYCYAVRFLTALNQREHHLWNIDARLRSCTVVYIFGYPVVGEFRHRYSETHCISCVLSLVRVQCSHFRRRFSQCVTFNHQDIIVFFSVFRPRQSQQHIITDK